MTNDPNPAIIARVSHGDLEHDPVEAYAIVASAPQAGTLSITADGRLKISPWPAGGLLEHAYAQIGTRLVGAVSLDDVTLWYDDEGRLAEQPQTNELATKLCGLQGPLACDIVGNVLITGAADDEGNTLPLTAEQLHELSALLEHLRRLPMPTIRSQAWW